MPNAVDSLDTRIEMMRTHLKEMGEMNPWGGTLGFVPFRIEKAHVWARQPYAEHLVGDPDSGVIHGGVITTLLDNMCGMSCAVAMEEFRFVATLDLRIDYMRPATKGEDVIGEAECYHLTKSVAFCRAWAYHDDHSRMIATAQGAFAINKPRPKPGQQTRAPL